MTVANEERSDNASHPSGRPRAIWTTVLLTLFMSPIGGFLWIGRGKLALAVFSLLLLALILLVPNLNSVVPWLVTFNADTANELIMWAAVFALSLVLVLPFRKSSRPNPWYSNIVAATLLDKAALLLPILVIKTLIVQPFSPTSSSMAPTLMPHDWFLVSKSAYGYGPFSGPISLPISDRIWSAAPERGDVVVFRQERTDYVMRVVGLPGETIRMTGGVLHIDGKAVKLVAEQHGELGLRMASEIQRETLPNGASYLVLNSQNGSQGDDTRDFLVPAGHYFVLGDNRDYSNDSRFATGFVSSAALIGKATRIIWNPNGFPVEGRPPLVAKR